MCSTGYRSSLSKDKNRPAGRERAEKLPSGQVGPFKQALTRLPIGAGLPRQFA